MRQLLFVILRILAVLPSFGELRLRMLETNDSTTVITLKEKSMREKASATSSRLYNDGKIYEALSIVSHYENCHNVYKVTFPRHTVLNNTKIELQNDKKVITQELWKQISEAAIRYYPQFNGSQILIQKPEYTLEY